MSNSLRCYCACSILVRGALGMTILTTTEEFEFLSIESWCSCSGPSKSPAIREKPGALKGTNLRSCLSCRSCAVVVHCPCILLTGFGFVSCLNKGIAIPNGTVILLHSSGFCCVRIKFWPLPELHET